MMIEMKEISDLSVAERILMIEKISDSINHDSIETSEAQERELDRRRARYEKGETKFVTWADIKNELTSN